MIERRAIGWLWAIAIALVLASTSAKAVEVDEILADPALEARARSISMELRCLVCQNQSIDDSHAPLAKDLRLIVRERLVAGDSDRQVIDFVVDRYGEFVLLRPRLSLHTAMLWGAAPVVLVIAGMLLWRLGRRTAVAPPLPLTADEEKRLARILDGSEQR
ncbi:MAG: cytochrome c-type biogenesis protein [Hyphomicrobiaceae bacterium]